MVLSALPKQFHKLREVGLSSEDALNRAVEVKTVRRDLKAFFASFASHCFTEFCCLQHGFFVA
jgi:hypothetical protein